MAVTERMEARLLCGTAGDAAMALGAAVLGCWWAGRPDLTALVGPTPVAPGTALFFILAGAALRCSLKPATRKAALALAAVIAAVGAGTLAQYLAGAPFPLGHWLVPRMARVPLQPSAYSAIAMLLSAASLATLDVPWPWWARPSDALALAVAAIGGLALAAHGYGVRFFRTLPAFEGSTMALLTAFGLLFVGLGLLCARPDRGVAAVVLSPRAGGFMARRLLAGALVVVPVLALLSVIGQKAGVYPPGGAVEVTMFSALVVILASVMFTARQLDHKDELREHAESRLADFIEQASDGIFVADLEGRYTAVNEAGCRMLGYSRAELLSKTILDLIPPEDAERLARVREALLKGGSHTGEWTLRRRDGRPLPVEVSAKILPDGRWQGIARDISERKRHEQERFRFALESAASAMLVLDEKRRVLSLNHQAARLFGYEAAEVLGRPLDELVGGDSGRRKDGTTFPAEVSVTRLEAADGPLVVATVVDVSERRRAEQALKETVAELEAFAYTASHNLRSPLRAVEGYARLAEQRLSPQADAESRSLLRKIGDAAVRLDRLIRDLLSYTDVSRAPLAAEPVDLDAVVSHVADQEAVYGRARVRVRSPLGRVFGQESLLFQAVLNLLANAVKFVPSSRSPEVDIWTEPAAGGRLRLVVQDNGIGIPPELQGKVFEPFERLHSAGYAGTGIGLAIVKKAVERMGGRVGLDSEAGRGSRFWLELPEA